MKHALCLKEVHTSPTRRWITLVRVPPLVLRVDFSNKITIIMGGIYIYMERVVKYVAISLHYLCGIRPLALNIVEWMPWLFQRTLEMCS